MGVTIHFEGRLKDEASFESALATTKQFCNEHSWPYELINNSHVILKRVRDEENLDYEGLVKGIAVQPHENSEPFRLEFDKFLYVQEYTKTQYAPINIHIELIELLRNLQPHFEHLEIIDEGEFFETGSHDALANHINRCFEVLDEYLVQEEKYYGPIRLENKRIVDVMSRD